MGLPAGSTGGRAERDRPANGHQPSGLTHPQASHGRYSNRTHAKRVRNTAFSATIGDLSPHNPAHAPDQPQTDSFFVRVLARLQRGSRCQTGRPFCGSRHSATRQTSPRLGLVRAGRHRRRRVCRLNQKRRCPRRRSLVRLRPVQHALDLCARPNLLKNSLYGDSSLAYFVARELRRSLDVPVGIINASMGGVSSESWTSEPAQLAEPKTLSCLRPAVNFNGMIAPILPYAIRGALWYQGEANSRSVESGLLYRKQLPFRTDDWPLILTKAKAR